MARAGTATVVLSSVVLGAALMQTLGFAGSEIAAPTTVVAVPTPTPDPAEVSTVASEQSAIMPMFRGNAAHRRKPWTVPARPPGREVEDVPRRRELRIAGGGGRDGLCR